MELNNNLNKINKKCNGSCSRCKPIRCSENPYGYKGECEYWKQCGVTAFRCEHMPISELTKRQLKTNIDKVNDLYNLEESEDKREDLMEELGDLVNEYNKRGGKYRMG